MSENFKPQKTSGQARLRETELERIGNGTAKKDFRIFPTTAATGNPEFEFLNYLRRTMENPQRF